MSAYVVDGNHINFLVAAGLSRGFQRLGGNKLRWRAAPEYDHDTGEEHGWNVLTDETAERVGQMLWDENIRSVRARYSDSKSNDLPGPITDGVPAEEAFVYQPVPWLGRINPVEVIKACDCYEYQTCETDDWRQTEAFRFIEALQSRAMHVLPGYEEAPWGAPKNRYSGEWSAVKL